MKKNTVYKTITVILVYYLFQISRLFLSFWRLLRRNFVIHFDDARYQLIGYSFITASQGKPVHSHSLAENNVTDLVQLIQATAKC